MTNSVLKRDNPVQIQRISVVSRSQLEKHETIWVTGAGGLIGGELLRSAPSLNLRRRVIALTRSDLELRNPTAVQRRFEEERPTAILHCAALSRSPLCEANPETARLDNVEATRHLVELSSETRLIFLSTDLVFDGLKGAYREEDPTNPLSEYARTKVQAEALVRTHPRHLIVRTSLNYGHTPGGNRSFNEEMAQAWRAGKLLKLFVDEFRCPIPVSVTARALWELLEQEVVGTLHLAGAERLSRWDIGSLLAVRQRELNPRLEPSSLKDYRGAPRSPDIALDSSRAQRLLSFPLPRFSEWLEEHEPIK